MVFNGFMDTLCRAVFLKDGTILPEKYMVGFSTTVPNLDGSNITEPSSDTGYARVELTNMTTDGNGIAYNADEINFGEATAPWGTFIYCILYSNEGEPLSAGQMSKQVTVDEGETLKIRTGNIKLYFGEAAVTA